MSILIAELWFRFLFMETLISFSNRLAYALQCKGVRPVELAKFLGVSRAAVSLLLSGQNKGMRPEHLVRTADWLGVRIEWLATGEGAMQPRRLSVQQRALLALTDDLPAEAIETMLRLLVQVKGLQPDASQAALPKPSR